MGWYNVVEPCVVGQLHYARPTVQPIELDDEVAAPLVEAGNLTPYPAVETEPESESADDTGDQGGDPPVEQSAPPARGRRRAEG